MNKKIKLIIGACVWSFIIVIASTAVIASCSEKEPISETPSEEGQPFMSLP